MPQISHYPPVTMTTAVVVVCWTNRNTHNRPYIGIYLPALDQQESRISLRCVLIPFSAPLASSFNWGPPFKSVVATKGFIGKIGVLVRPITKRKCNFFQYIYFFLTSKWRSCTIRFLITRPSFLLNGKINIAVHPLRNPFFDDFRGFSEVLPHNF